MDDARTNRSEHRDPVITSDGAILMSHAYGGMDLEWASYALLASHYLDKPIEPCEIDCPEMHLLGPGVSINESDKSIAWRWSPERLKDIDITSPDLQVRVASTCGANTLQKIKNLLPFCPAEGHPSLSITKSLSLGPDPLERSGTGVVLHFKHWDRWKFFLEEAGYTPIPAFWNERSRDPLEEVRERFIQIASCERIISTTVAGLGISNACGIPFLYARDDSRPIFHRLDEVTKDCFPFMEFFSYLNIQDPLCVDISDIANAPEDKLENEMFQNPVQLDPQADILFTLPQALERYRVFELDGQHIDDD